MSLKICALLGACLFGLSLAAPKSSQTYYVWNFDQDWQTCLSRSTTDKNHVTYATQSRRNCFSSIGVGHMGCTGPENGKYGKAQLEANLKAGVKVDQMMPNRDCNTATCPKGYACDMGMYGGVRCCNIKYRDASYQVHDDKCPGGSEAPKVDGHVQIAMDCKNLNCGTGQKCVVINEFFAKCCKA